MDVVREVFVSRRLRDGSAGYSRIQLGQTRPELVANFTPESLAEWHRGTVVGSCRRDLLDHIVALNERHLKRLLSEYVRYHHEDRTHLGLEKGPPEGRIRSVAPGRVQLDSEISMLQSENHRLT